jgi:hypothetical protein
MNGSRLTAFFAELVFANAHAVQIHDASEHCPDIRRQDRGIEKAREVEIVD